MLFNTFHFIFLYLPITLAIFFFIAKKSNTLAAAWLAAASLFFYGSWDYRYLPLLIASITFNYWTSKTISNRKSILIKKRLLTFSISINLILLAYYKYANFFLSSLSELSGSDHINLDIILPIGISFFTFTQIAFLVDTYQGKVKEYNFTHYVLFVTYFPHLIAGPVLHHGEMMPQFAKKRTYLPSSENFAVGISIFVFGLAKKILIADNIAPLANPIFQIDSTPHLVEAWVGTLAYTMQLYFDFSGYSDMAIGLSRMFGVRLPVNFNSPYKAKNIIEFWRRWHMTLSRFLRDYLYIPLGGNRNGTWSRYRNLFITMLLGGLWHGAGWTYVIWGGMHGIYLGINHGWQSISKRFDWLNWLDIYVNMMSQGITFLSVVIAWVFFRSPDIKTAVNIIFGMTGFNGISHFDFSNTGIAYLLLAMGIVWLSPNTQEIMASTNPCYETIIPERSLLPVRWKINRPWLLLISSGFLFCILNMNKVSEFLYFQF